VCITQSFPKFLFKVNELSIFQADADTVAGTWKFSTAGDRDQFAAKIRRMPSIGVKAYSGELASFTVLDASGFFNNQFTFPEHRQRGLADKSELRLCQKVSCSYKAIFRMLPFFKLLEPENSSSSEGHGRLISF
ncbi:unnamed protein product, partial [Toxocara canis]|uniref:Glycine N-acyltransferase-like protein n=1 Tax=Toxocara canis TaxID=6265 RepID=A0A183U8G0_TOXCA